MIRSITRGGSLGSYELCFSILAILRPCLRARLSKLYLELNHCTMVQVRCVTYDAVSTLFLAMHSYTEQWRMNRV